MFNVKLVCKLSIFSLQDMVQLNKSFKILEDILRTKVLPLLTI